AMADLLGHGLVDHGFFLIDLALAFMIIFGTGLGIADGSPRSERPRPAGIRKAIAYPDGP
ncbi:hypothetical protein, partial [Thermoflexus hugenholtzii]